MPTNFRFMTLLFVLAVVVFTAGFGLQQTPSTPAPAPRTASTPSAQSSDKPQEKTVQESNDASAAALRAQIKGHEQEPASKVFKNVKFMTDAPAGRFLNIMNMGYSRALGVKCDYCHDEADYSSDVKRPKRAAREMQVMHHDINTQLGKMQNLQPKSDGQYFINCGTCHRGMIDPTKPLPK